jgi:hypothetical protein
MSTQLLVFNNALAIYGLVPFINLMIEYHKAGLKGNVSLCKAALCSFKGDKRFMDIVQGNRSALNMNNPVLSNDVSIYDVALTELGYYETYNKANLESDMIQLVGFINQMCGV